MYRKRNILGQSCCCYTSLSTIAQYVERYCMMLHLSSGTCFLMSSPFSPIPNPLLKIAAYQERKQKQTPTKKKKKQSINEKQVPPLSFSCRNRRTMPSSQAHRYTLFHSKDQQAFNCTERSKESKRSLIKGMGILNTHLRSRKMPGHKDICCLFLAVRMSEKIANYGKEPST